MSFREKTLTSKFVFEGKIVRLEIQDVELEDGRTAYRELVRHKGAIGVLARTPEGRFLFVRQFRKPVEALMTEVVAGILEAGEEPEDAARRELREETGRTALRLVHLGTLFASPGYVDERIEAYYADVGGDVEALDPDEDERIDVLSFTMDEVERMIASNELRDAKTLAMWAMYRRWRDSDS